MRYVEDEILAKQLENVSPELQRHLEHLFGEIMTESNFAGDEYSIFERLVRALDALAHAHAQLVLIGRAVRRNMADGDMVRGEIERLIQEAHRVPV